MICKNGDSIGEIFNLNFIINAEFEEVKGKISGWANEEDKNTYYIDGCGIVGYVHRNSDLEIKNYNCFTDLEKANEINRMNLLQRMMKKFADENNEKEINWKDKEQSKYSISYDTVDCKFKIFASWMIMDINRVYFTSEEIAQKCADEIIRPFMNNEI